jgi:hypothetical protein
LVWQSEDGPVHSAHPMLGLLHFPRVLMLYPFRYCLERTGKWVKARYVAERHVIAEQYAEWEIIGRYRRASGSNAALCFAHARSNRSVSSASGRWDPLGKLPSADALDCHKFPNRRRAGG